MYKRRLLEVIQINKRHLKITSVLALIRILDMDYSTELIMGTHIKELEGSSHNLLKNVKMYETFSHHYILLHNRLECLA